MQPKTSLLAAALAGAALVASAPAAFAGDRDDGWRDRPPPPCNCNCGCQEETVTLPSSFFADSGGVGPAFIDTGGGGGGGFVFAGAAASASAFASASARVSVNFNFHGHPPHPPMHMKHGGKW